jgi:manganese/iron transport system ATP-binding protein
MEILEEIRNSPLSGHGVAHQGGAPILEVSGLSVRYETGQVLDDVTFHLHTAERIAVVGPNGAGKSTLFKVIAGVLPPSEGEVKIYGHNPRGHICIAYLPQRNQVDWNFPVNVADVVMMGRSGKLGLLRWPHRRDWDFVHKSLQEVGLDHLANRQISELSGGQQQRMFIARALAQEAELMLMDEPLTGLDIGSQEDIFSILDNLRRRQTTIMIATHDLEQAAERFDRVLLLNHQVLGFGSPQAVFTPQRLTKAYGGRLRLVQSGEDVLALTDSCCDEGEQDR